MMWCMKTPSVGIVQALFCHAECSHNVLNTEIITANIQEDSKAKTGRVRFNWRI